MKISAKDVLIVVDVQNDFCPRGALAVPDGDKVVPKLNKVMGKFRYVIATQDWHPKNHISFKAQGGIWPPHCVQGTKGADFHPKLNSKKFTHIVRKGTDPKKEAYSGFDETGLESLLKSLRIRHVFVGGLATDYCVKATTLDSREAQFSTFVLKDAARAVNVKPGDEKKAFKKMQQAGAKLISITDIY